MNEPFFNSIIAFLEDAYSVGKNITTVRIILRIKNFIADICGEDWQAEEHSQLRGQVL